MNYLLFCNADKDGNIIDSFSGANIIPSKQYDYFFLTQDKGVVEDISKYKIDLTTRVLTVK
jgi:hypothetical protein